MADKIYMDTQLMEQLSSQIRQLQHSLSSINSGVSRSIAEVRRVASDQQGIINRLYNTQRNLVMTSERADKLARATENAASRWAEAERRITSQKLPEFQNDSQGQGGGSSSGNLHSIWDIIRNTPWGKLWAYPFLPMMGPFQLGYIAIGALSQPGVRNALYNFFTDKISGEAAVWSDSWEKDGFFVKGNVLGGSVKTKGKASWDITKGNFGATQGITVEGHLAQVEGGYKGKYGQISSKATVGGASATGEVGLTLFENGKFDPQVYAKAKAEAYVFRSEVSGKLGNDDVNVYASKETTLLGAEADVKVGYIRDDDGNKKLAAKANAEAYVAKGEIKGGFEIFGIKIGGSAEVMVGANATAGGEVGSDSASGEIGLGPIKVKLNIDWSGFAKRFF